MVRIDSALPLYLQIKEMLVRQIRSGLYQPHQALPTEQQLMDQYRVSRITVRRALSDLANEGLVYRKVGRGTFVAADPIVETVTELVGHLEELQRRGLDPEVVLLEQEVRMAPPEAMAALRDAAVVLFTRRRVAVYGEPLLLLDLCLPSDIGLLLDPQELTGVPVHALLERRGLVAYAGEQRVAARGVTVREGELLGIDPGAPVLEVVRTEWTSSGRELLWSRALYRGDRYQYVIQLHRPRKRN